MTNGPWTRGLVSSVIGAVVLGGFVARPIVAQPVTAAATTAATQPVAAQPAPPAQSVDQLVVTFAAESVPDATVEALAESLDEPAAAGNFIAPDTGTIDLEAPLTPAEAEQLAAEVAQDPRVLAVEPARWVSSDSVSSPPNDPFFPDQWALSQFGSDTDALLADPYALYLSGTVGTNIQSAWSAMRGEVPVVAVIDTGYTEHPDLDGRFLPGYDFVSDPRMDSDDQPGRDADAGNPGEWVSEADKRTPPFSSGAPCEQPESEWHGTRVASVIGSTVNNAIGGAGAIPDANLLPIRVLGKCGWGSTVDIAAAIRWAAGLEVPGVPLNPHPAKVINLSLGGLGACLMFEQDAIDAATAQGAVIVASAGNENAPAASHSPSNCRNVISVAATNNDGTRRFDSNYGAGVDIAAPGDGIFVATDTGLTGPEGPGYTTTQGTSFAAPYVAAGAALVMAANPAATPDQVRNILTSTATRFPGLDPFGYNTGSEFDRTCIGERSCGAGVLNIGKALGAVTPPGPVVSPSVAFQGLPAGVEEFTFAFEPPADEVEAYRALIAYVVDECTAEDGCRETVEVIEQPLTGPGATVQVEIPANASPWFWPSGYVQARNASGWGTLTSAFPDVPLPVDPELPPPAAPLWASESFAAPWYSDYESAPTAVKLQFIDTSYEIDDLVAVAEPGGHVCVATRTAWLLSCIIDGLNPGDEFEVTAVAFNAGGMSEQSSSRVVKVGSQDPAFQATVPDPPVVRGPTFADPSDDGFVDVTLQWSAPQWEGASPITEYSTFLVEGDDPLTDDSLVCEGPQTQCTVTLPVGANRTMLVTANNAVGASTAAVFEFDVPDRRGPVMSAAPTVSVSDGRTTISWEPGEARGAPIVEYVVTTNSGDFACYILPPRDPDTGENVDDPLGSSCQVDDLIIGEVYEFQVTAIDIRGRTDTTAFSEPVTITGTATVPSLPTTPSAQAGAEKAVVFMEAGARRNGGSPITGYEITATPGGATCAISVPDWQTTPSCVVTGLTPGVAYTFTTTAINAVGRSLPSDPSTPVTPFPQDARFTAMSPIRVLDTRAGADGRQAQPMSAGAPIVLDLADVVPEDTTAVSYNVVVTGQTASGYAEVAPAGAVSGSSTINWGGPVQTIANGHISKLNQNRELVVVVGGTGTADVIIDITGAFTISGDAGFSPVLRRVYDSRDDDGPLAAGQSRTVNINTDVRAMAESPAPTAAAVNITVTATTGSGVLSVAKEATSATSSINWSGANQTVANAVITDVAEDGSFTVTNNGRTATELVVDLTGVFTPAQGAAFYAVNPVRAYDSRADRPLTNTRPRLTRYSIPGEMDATVVAVALNTTVTGTTGSGWLSVTHDTGAPSTSTVNWFRSPTTRANGTIVGTSGDSTYAHVGGFYTTHYLLDLVGYFAQPAG